MAASIVNASGFQVTFDQGLNDGDPVTTGNFTVSAGSNLCMWVALLWNDSNGHVDTEGVSFNGDAFTRVGSGRLDMTSLAIDVWRLVNPDVTTAGIVIDPSNGVAHDPCAVIAWVTDNTDQTTPHDTRVTATNSDFGAPFDSTCDVPSGNGDLVIVLHGVLADAAASAAAYSGYTESTEQQVAGQFRYLQLGYAAGTGGTVNTTARWTGSLTAINPWGSFGFNVNAAAVAATTYTVTELTISPTVG